MQDEERNELVRTEESNASTGKSGELESALYAMQSLTSMVAGLSQQVAQNNAEKYRAQAEIVIAEIEKDKETELREIDKYYDTRMQTGADIAKVIADSQAKITDLMKASMNAQNQADRENANMNIQEEREQLKELLATYTDMIREDQNTRIQNSKPRNKGLFGFLKRK